MKTKIGVVGCIAILVLASSCASSQEYLGKETVQGRSVSVAAERPGQEVQTVSVSGDLAKTYPNIEALAKDSDKIIRGHVSELHSVEKDGQVYTFYRLKVEKEWKGKPMGADSINADSINVVMLGGITTAAYLKESSGRPSGITDADRATKVQVLFEGMPIPETGSDQIAFLGEGAIGIVPGVYYVAVGAYQGLLRVSEEQAARHVPDASGLALPDLRAPVTTTEAQIAKAVGSPPSVR